MNVHRFCMCPFVHKINLANFILYMINTLWSIQNVLSIPTRQGATAEYIKTLVSIFPHQKHIWSLFHLPFHLSLAFVNELLNRWLHFSASHLPPLTFNPKQSFFLPAPLLKQPSPSRQVSFSHTSPSCFSPRCILFNSPAACDTVEQDQLS